MTDRLLTAFAVLLASFGCAMASAATEPKGERAAPAARSAVMVKIDGAIGPATSGHFQKTLGESVEDGASMLIVELDTPGGLDDSMRDMIQAILASPIPVVMYVAPSGARAASAGTYLMYASHVAAMAPATNLGAATPIQIGGGGEPAGAPPVSPVEPGDKPDGKKSDKDSGGKSDGYKGGSALERKAVNDAVAYIRSLAELRGRNADWGEKAVREGASLSAERAVEAGVADLVAEDLPSLLAAIDGREVKVGDHSVTLATKGLVIREVETDWRTNLLALITNPNLAYLLMLIGIYGLLLEGYHPGAIVPGVVGAICLVLALFAFQVLSVNYAGLALIALGVLMIVAESFVPAFGALGLGGIIAFVFGSILLLDNELPGYQIAKPLIGAIAFVASLMMFVIARFALRARRRPVVTGAGAMLRETAEAVESFERNGRVRVYGELWNAVTRVPVREGQRLRILRVDGLTLEVEPKTD